MSWVNCSSRLSRAHSRPERHRPYINGDVIEKNTPKYSIALNVATYKTTCMDIGWGAANFQEF